MAAKGAKVKREHEISCPIFDVPTFPALARFKVIIDNIKPLNHPEFKAGTAI